MLDTPDGELYDTKEEELRLAEIMRKNQVNAVLYHWKNSLHKDHEAAHMEDVRGLIRLDLWVCIGSGTLAVLATAAGFLRRDGRRRFLRGMMQGILGTAGIALLLGAWALLDFDGLFVTFHRVAFRNDGWLLNPKTDLLIRLMPVTFFIRLGIRGLLRFALFAAVFTAAVGIGLRRKKDEV